MVGFPRRRKRKKKTVDKQKTLVSPGFRAQGTRSAASNVIQTVEPQPLKSHTLEQDPRALKAKKQRNVNGTSPPASLFQPDIQVLVRCKRNKKR